MNPDIKLYFIFFISPSTGHVSQFHEGYCSSEAAAVRGSPPRTWLIQPEEPVCRVGGTGNRTRVLPLHGLRRYQAAGRLPLTLYTASFQCLLTPSRRKLRRANSFLTRGSSAAALSQSRIWCGRICQNGEPVHSVKAPLRCLRSAGGWPWSDHWSEPYH